MADMPDLSHLTAEERAIIESVMMRQKQEEERENEIMRRKQDEVAVLEDTIRHRAEQQRKREWSSMPPATFASRQSLPMASDIFVTTAA
uniref:RabBD domain-containing protein n=1 Tax=Lutzomyia longipalpis TaxID=7200 RepID=A0A1B0FV10_LUTLO